MTDFLVYSTSQLRKIRDDFFSELVEASQGKKSSIAFIKNLLPTKPIITQDQIFQTMVIGGRIFEKALFAKNKNKTILLESKKANLPFFQDKQMFFAFVAKHLNQTVNYLVVNFAYGLKQVIREDGLIDGIKLASGGKGQKFSGLTGQLVGKEIERYILAKNNRTIKVCLANDSICLLLSGLDKNDHIKTAAGIVGAGTNFSFFLDQKTAVNLESGNFNKFPQTKTTKKIDQNSTNPGRHLFEKEVSGAYLHQHYNLLTNNSKNENKEAESTEKLSFLANCGDVLAQKIFERSASLIACQIAGIYQFKNLKFQVSNLKFIMEGSVFWKSWHYTQLVNSYLKKLGVEKNKTEFVKVPNSSLIGAAKLI